MNVRARLLTVQATNPYYVIELTVTVQDQSHSYSITTHGDREYDKSVAEQACAAINRETERFESVGLARGA